MGNWDVTVRGSRSAQGPGSLSAFPASSDRFYLHQQPSFFCFRSPAFPASKVQFFLHWNSGIRCIACHPLASGYPHASPKPSCGPAWPPPRCCWMSGRWSRRHGTRCGGQWMPSMRLGNFCSPVQLTLTYKSSSARPKLIQVDHQTREQRVRRDA
jgi:hypothetical protein